MRKFFKTILLCAGIIMTGLLFTVPAYATQPNPPIPRSQPAPEQFRFNYSYEFTSGMDYRFDLGRPTTWHGVVLQDVFTANVRRDANVSLKPPSPRTGNTIAPTDSSNPAFVRFSNQQSLLHASGFWNPIELMSPCSPTSADAPISRSEFVLVGTAEVEQALDSSQGGSGGFLPPTSVR